MDLPYVKEGILYFENSRFPIKNFCYDAMMEMINEEASLDMAFVEGTKQVTFIFPNSTGKIFAYFLYENVRMSEEKGEALYEFEGGLKFTELHFQLYRPITAKRLLNKHGSAVHFETEGQRFMAFNQNFLALKEKEMVKCLWFISPNILHESKGPLYSKLIELFE